MILEQLKQTAVVQGMVSGIFSISKVLTQLSFLSTNRNCADIPSSKLAIYKIIRDLYDPQRSSYLGNITVTVKKDYDFEPDAYRMVISGHGMLAFLILLAGELYRILKTVDGLSSDEIAQLETLKSVLVMPTGERRMNFMNHSVENLMTDFIIGFLTGGSIPIPDEPNRDEQPIIDCYFEINKFFASGGIKPVIETMSGLINKAVVNLVQSGNDQMTHSLLQGSIID